MRVLHTVIMRQLGLCPEGLQLLEIAQELREKAIYGQKVQ